jgi:hypothetical protein
MPDDQERSKKYDRILGDSIFAAGRTTARARRKAFARPDKSPERGRPKPKGWREQIRWWLAPPDGSQDH